MPRLLGGDLAELLVQRGRISPADTKVIMLRVRSGPALKSLPYPAAPAAHADARRATGRHGPLRGPEPVPAPGAGRVATPRPLWQPEPAAGTAGTTSNVGPTPRVITRRRSSRGWSTSTPSASATGTSRRAAAPRGPARARRAFTLALLVPTRRQPPAVPKSTPPHAPPPRPSRPPPPAAREHNDCEGWGPQLGGHRRLWARVPPDPGLKCVRFRSPLRIATLPPLLPGRPGSLLGGGFGAFG